MSDDCDHEFDGEPSNFKDIGGLEHDSGLPLQMAANAQCTKCGRLVDLDYNLAFIDGKKA